MKFPKILFYFIFAVFPILLWVLGNERQLVFSDFYSGLLTLAKAAGILGISLYSGNLILSGRYHFLDRAYHGLDRLYLFHRKTGIVAFSLLCFHVLAISLLPLQISLTALYKSLFDFSNLAVNFGRIAFAGVFAIIVFTLVSKERFKYEIRKKIHQFLGVFLFIAGLHVFFIPSDIARNIFLRSYVLTLVGLALASWLSRTVLKSWLLKKISCEVISVRLVNPSTTEVVIQPKNSRKVHFYPGQFIFIKFFQKNFPKEEHPFSLTNSSEDPLLKICAKQIGDFTKILPELKPGANALVHGPFGGFTFLASSHKNQIWIAGGIGATPFISMARSLHDQRDKFTEFHIHMIYSAALAEEFVFRDELEHISKTAPNFTFIPWIAKDKGYLTVKSIKEITEIQKKEIFICGPKPMMFSLKDQFMDEGIPPSRVRFELFRLL